MLQRTHDRKNIDTLLERLRATAVERDRAGGHPNRAKTSRIVRRTARWMPGALLRREPATFNTAPSGKFRLIQRTTRATAASGAWFKSTFRHGLPCCFAKAIVSNDPPSGLP